MSSSATLVSSLVTSLSSPSSVASSFVISTTSSFFVGGVSPAPCNNYGGTCINYGGGGGVGGAVGGESPAPTSSTNSNNNNVNSSSGGPTQNSPLLFFVALGFGVVFTNLWIIVGVKYCFRYNRRARARAAGIDDVDLQALGARPHRRRREKKLMTVDEVNERFPVTKYKTWRATREVMGLPTAGGITAPAEGVVPTTQVNSVELPASTPPKVPEPVADPLRPNVDRQSSDSPAKPSSDTRPDNIDADDHEEDEAVAAVPADIANTSGDTCAICIDNLEDSDDIRGLTCGHAFHTACIDPWLTSRRACCPLCKHDYYVPKPRTEAEIQAEEEARERRRQAAEVLNRSPFRGWWFRAETYLTPPVAGNNERSRRPQNAHARTNSEQQTPGSRWNPFSSSNRRSPAEATENASTSPEIRQEGSSGPAAIFARFARRSRGDTAVDPSSTTGNPTPSTLEAGLAERGGTRSQL